MLYALIASSGVGILYYELELIYFLTQVQEFEHINGFYSMPDAVKRTLEARKPPVPVTGDDEKSSTATPSTNTPATSAAPSPAPDGAVKEEKKDDEEKDKDVSADDKVSNQGLPTYIVALKVIQQSYLKEPVSQS